MDPLALSLAPETRARLEALAVQTGQSVAQCLDLAVLEFLDRWETHLADLATLDEDEARAVVHTATE